MKAVAALNVYKRVAVIRRETDSLAYEDAEGSVKTVTDLGQAASTAVCCIVLHVLLFLLADRGTDDEDNLFTFLSFSGCFLSSISLLLLLLLLDTCYFRQQSQT